MLAFREQRKDVLFALGVSSFALKFPVIGKLVSVELAPLACQSFFREYSCSTVSCFKRLQITSSNRILYIA